MKDQFPAGWQRVSLADLGMGRTQTVSPSDFPTTTFELWSVPSFPSGSPEIILGKDIGSSKQRVQCGDVLLCKINPRINRVWVVGDKHDKEQIASTEWIVFRAQHLVPDYLAYAFRESSFREKFTANVSGVGGSLTRARPTDVADLDVPIAPVNEQRRIVAKLDALFEKSRAIREKLDRAPRLLANLQKSILNAAFREVDEWRTIGEIGNVSGGLTKNAKRQSLSLKHPYLRVANVYADELRLEDVHTVGVTEAEVNKTRLKNGDLLVVEGNGSIDQIGRVARFGGEIEDCLHQNHLRTR